MKRAISWLLMLLILMTCVPATVLAEPETVIATESVIADPESADGEELLEGYIYQLFYGRIATYRRKAGDQLTGNTKILYDALVPILRKIAAGQRTSTVIGVGKDVYTYEGWFYADAEATFSGADLDLNKLLDALLTDLPYEMYWYDKTAPTVSWKIGGASISQIVIEFPVTENYRGNDDLTVDCGQAAAAVTAAGNSAAIVSKYATKTDYEKLLGYKNEICDLTDYDYDAAWAGNYSEDDDPWQLIHVFDGDEDTKVVCEGYSKAFMYLCQQTAFAEDVTCVTVYGMMGGAHMWNIVTLEGENYLVDVTNSESDSVGYDGRFFLAGGTGSITAGYTIGGYTYTYRDAYGNLNRMVELWGSDADSILNLASQSYTPPEGVQITGVTLRSETAGLYYAGSFNVSGKVQVVRRGVAVSLVSQNPVADGTDPNSFWTEGMSSILIANILDAEESDTENARRATLPVYARAYVQRADGTYLYSDPVSMTLQQVVEAADSKWQTLDETQKAALAELYATFSQTMSTWNIPNLKAN